MDVRFRDGAGGGARWCGRTGRLQAALIYNEIVHEYTEEYKEK